MDDKSKLDISIYGDVLEREYYNLIREKIPAYEYNWQKYIGNDGKNHMLNLKIASPRFETFRLYFTELHYTCLESLISMKLIIDKIGNYVSWTPKDLILQNNDIICFHAHIGRIRDCIVKIGNKLGCSKVHKDFENSYKERCSIVHDRKSPYFIEEKFYFVLKNASLIDGKSWSDFKLNDFKYLDDYLNDTFDVKASNLNACLDIFQSKLKDKFGDNILETENVLNNPPAFPSDTSAAMNSKDPDDFHAMFSDIFSISTDELTKGKTNKTSKKHKRKKN